MNNDETNKIKKTEKRDCSASTFRFLNHARKAHCTPTTGLTLTGKFSGESVLLLGGGGGSIKGTLFGKGMEPSDPEKCKKVLDEMASLAEDCLAAERKCKNQ